MLPGRMSHVGDEVTLRSAASARSLEVNPAHGRAEYPRARPGRPQPRPPNACCGTPWRARHVSTCWRPRRLHPEARLDRTAPRLRRGTQRAGSLPLRAWKGRLVAAAPLGDGPALRQDHRPRKLRIRPDHHPLPPAGEEADFVYGFLTGEKGFPKSCLKVRTIRSALAASAATSPSTPPNRCPSS